MCNVKWLKNDKETLKLYSTVVEHPSRFELHLFSCIIAIIYKNVKIKMDVTYFSGNENGMFQMDPLTGAVQQIKSVTDANFPGAEIRLVIKVTKNLSFYICNED